jgi:hypothetical protein
MIQKQLHARLRFPNPRSKIEPDTEALSLLRPCDLVSYSRRLNFQTGIVYAFAVLPPFPDLTSSFGGFFLGFDSSETPSFTPLLPDPEDSVPAFVFFFDRTSNFGGFLLAFSFSFSPVDCCGGRL